MSPSTLPALPRLSRNAVIIGGVVLMHGAALRALQSGLLKRAVEVVVPAEILAEFIAPPPPPAPPAPAPLPVAQPPKPEPPKPRVAAPAPKPRPAPRPEPAPLAVQEAAPTAPVVTAAPPEPPSRAPVAAPVSPPAPPAPPVVVLPSSNASYLNNPKPSYPAMSRRLGETGRVVLRVLIGTDGRAQEAHIQRSSGYERLDQVALETVRDRWRYQPGTRNGVPEAMWFNVPINFVLE